MWKVKITFLTPSFVRMLFVLFSLAQHSGIGQSPLSSSESRESGEAEVSLVFSNPNLCTLGLECFTGSHLFNMQNDLLGSNAHKALVCICVASDSPIGKLVTDV